MGVSMKDTGPITVLKALTTAEGANATAGLHHAKIIRKGGNGTSEIPVDITQIMQAKAPDVSLQADDILFVPSSAGKSARKPQYYDAPPSDPMQGPTPIYIR
jgi:polysaccharide export outer membrane protein